MAAWTSLLPEKTCLVVGEGAALVALVAAVLRQIGLKRVQECLDPASAPGLLAEEPSSFVVCVDAAPHAASAAVRTIRRSGIPGAEEVPIVFLSRELSRSVIDRALDDGATTLATLPVTARRMLRCATSALEDERPFVKTSGHVGPCRRKEAREDGAGPWRRSGDSPLGKAARPFAASSKPALPASPPTAVPASSARSAASAPAPPPHARPGQERAASAQEAPILRHVPPAAEPVFFPGRRAPQEDRIVASMKRIGELIDSLRADHAAEGNEASQVEIRSAMDEAAERLVNLMELAASREGVGAFAAELVSVRTRFLGVVEALAETRLRELSLRIRRQIESAGVVLGRGEEFAGKLDQIEAMLLFSAGRDGPSLRLELLLEGAWEGVMGVLKEEEAFALPEFSDVKRKAVVERRRRSAGVFDASGSGAAAGGGGRRNARRPGGHV